MSYIVTNEKWPKGGIDMPAFAADLVKAFNALGITAKLGPAGDYPHERQSIDLGDSTELSLYADNWKHRISASISATDVPWEDRSNYNKDHRTASAKVSPEGRSIEALARDIRRRVIAASAGALKLQRDYAAAQAGNRNSIKERAAALAAACPALSVRVNEREQNATLYYNQGSAYLSGTLSHDGSVRMRDVSGITADKMARLLALLSSK